MTKNLQISRQEAAQELLSRRQAREGLIAFTQYTNPAYCPADHHTQIAEKLEAVERGEIDRLMIFMPPRHGKSELASRRFPAWFLGRHCDQQIISATYNADFASDFGREVRNIVASPEYGALFDVGLSQDSKAANRWHTSGRGCYIAAGVGTSVTGRGANIALIDDPFKDRQAADSEINRERVWNWYTSTLYTRLMPGGAIVLIQTRWHDDDLAGRLLAAQENGTGDKWEVLELKAETDGKALWPEWYPYDALMRIKAAVGKRDWNSLYQQNPIPDDGDFFLRDWFRWYDDEPKNLKIYGASDYAVTEGGGDFTEHGVMGVDANDDIYLLDWWSGQTTSDVWIETQLDLTLRHKPRIWAGESGPIRRSVEPFLKKRVRERKAYCRLEWLPSITDKTARARGIQARASMGKVYLPRNAPWVDDLLHQLLRFPAGTFDDKVDVMSLFGRMLDMVFAAKPDQKPPEGPKPGTFEHLLKVTAKTKRKSTYRMD